MRVSRISERTREFDAVNDCGPFKVARIAPRHVPTVVEREQMQPPIFEQRSHAGMATQNIRHRRAWCFDADRQAQRLVSVPLAVVDGLPGQTCPQHSAVTLDDTDAARDVVQEFIAGAKNLRGDG